MQPQSDRTVELVKGLRHIARQNDQIILLLERRTATPSVFLSQMWKAFSKQLSTTIGQWLAGLPLWLLALEALGLRQLLEKLAGLFG